MVGAIAWRCFLAGASVDKDFRALRLDTILLICLLLCHYLLLAMNTSVNMHERYLLSGMLSACS